ncbi:MAG TPA: hypothetical protein VE780_06690, partial [Thermoleophilaceae bacterium]|nr:hypothetical protein [Thermoleophilaceae bacterium]
MFDPRAGMVHGPYLSARCGALRERARRQAGQVDAGACQMRLVGVAELGGEARPSEVEVEDKGFNPLGVKGVGEIGQVGVAAAIGNAIFNATGRRIRRLPLAAELVMD